AVDDVKVGCGRPPRRVVSARGYDTGSGDAVSAIVSGQCHRLPHGRRTSDHHLDDWGCVGLRHEGHTRGQQQNREKGFHTRHSFFLSKVGKQYFLSGARAARCRTQGVQAFNSLLHSSSYVTDGTRYSLERGSQHTGFKPLTELNLECGEHTCGR